jgi:hypothetical protein
LRWRWRSTRCGLAHSPRYWERYFVLLSNPLARLVVCS